MRYYAVYDTNVLISSFLTKNPDAATVQAVDAIPDETIWYSAKLSWKRGMITLI